VDESGENNMTDERTPNILPEGEVVGQMCQTVTEDHFPKHIVVFLPHGFAARMVIRSGVAERIIRAGVKITVISANADEPYFQKECEKEGVACLKDKMDVGRMAEWFRVHRSYFLDDVLNNVTLKTNHDARYETRPVFKKVLELINRFLAPKTWFRKIAKAIELRVNKDPLVRQTLTDLRPDLLVLMNPFGEKETVYLSHARELGIPVACQMLSWDNITSKGTPLQMPDYFLSWGPIMTQEMIEWYDFPRERIYECGVAHFDVYSQKETFATQKEIVKKYQLPANLPYIFYGMVSEMMCGKEVDTLERLVAQINSQAFIKPCSLIIRPHPQTISGSLASGPETLKRIQALAGPRVAIDMPVVLSEKLAWDLPKNDMTHLASLLNGSAMCINASSTLCLDACMVNKPVIAVGFDGDETVPYKVSARRSLDCTHMVKLFAFGGIPIAKTFDNLKEHIDTILLNPKLGQEGRARAVSQECGPGDGRGSERVSEALIQLVGQS